MNKFFFLLIFFAICSTHSNAQVSFRPGLRGGANISKITQMDASFKTGFYLAGYGELRLGKVYALQPEFTYGTQGGDDLNFYYYDNNLNQEVLGREDVKIEYISLGLINKFYFNDRINIHFGPMIDILSGPNPHLDTEVDLSFTAGLGFNIFQGLAVEARVKKGILDVMDSSYNYYYDSYELGDYNTNFLFQVGLSYTFAFKN